MLSFAAGLGLGLVLGALGSLTGIGGGFLLMPLLLWLYPDQPAAALSAATLTVVLCNSLASSAAGLRRGRVRWRTGLVYGLLALPLAWAGAWLQGTVGRGAFTAAFGWFLVAGALFLVFQPGPSPRKLRKRVWAAGAGVSLALGFLCGFFGVGGGFLFVPLLAFALGFPMAEAAATGQLIVGIGAAGVLAAGLLGPGLPPLPLPPPLLAGLVGGVILGAPAGAWAGGRWKAVSVLRLLAVLLALAGLKFLLS